jgi:Membrane-bound toxin component of toxin-antitoxin system
MAVLRLELRASRTLAVVLALLHLGAALCLLMVLPGYVGMSLALLILALGGAAARDKALLRAPGSVCALELAGDGAATLELADGRRLAGRVSPRRHVGGWWVVLPVSGGTRRSVLVLRDMLSTEDFRFLRLWALWGRVPEAVQRPQTA